MNNKAFTLVELIAILLVLVIIFLICFPALQNLGKSDTEKEYSQMMENLCIAGEAYINANIDDYNNLGEVNSTIQVDILTLINYGNVDANLKNPRTKEKVNGDYLIYTVLDDKSLSCEYKDV